MNKRNILIYSDWIRAALTLLLVITPTPWLALPIIGLRNTAGAFSLPAQQGLMRSIVSEEHIMQAVTINGSLFQLVKVVGPLLGGSIASISSPQIAIAINGFAFILSGLLLLRIRIQEDTSKVIDPSKPREPLFQAWKEGWRIIWHNRILRASIIFGMFSTLTIQMIDVQIVSLFSLVFPTKPEFTGWAISAVGIGSLVVVVVLNRYKKLISFGWFFGLGSLLIGFMATGLGFLSLFNYMLLAIILAILGGIGNGLTYTAINYLIQSEPPKEAIGRITGIIDSLMSVLFIAGPLLGGFFITQLGVLTTFKTIGFTLMLIGFIGIILKNYIWHKQENTSIGTPNEVTQ